MAYLVEVIQLALAEGDGHVFALDRSEATRNGVSLNSTCVTVFRLQGGRVQSVEQYFENTAESDAFLGLESVLFRALAAFRVVVGIGRKLSHIGGNHERSDRHQP